MLTEPQHRQLLYPRLLEFGVSYGDLLAIETCLDEGGFDPWSLALFEKAEAYRRRGREREEQARLISASSFYRRACDYFHFSALRSEAVEPRVARRRSEHCFADWRRCANPPLQIEELECLGEKVTLHHSGWSGKATVLLVGGLDSSKECELWYFSRYFASRGMNVAYVDFPGQGQLFGKLGLIDHGDAYSQALLSHVADLSGEAPIAVFGVSLGGYLALRATALCPQVSCAISLGGFFDAGVFGNLRADARPRLNIALTCAEADPPAPALARVRLDDAAARLDCPALIIHGADDHLVPLDQIDRMSRWAPRATLDVVDGAEHVATSRFSVVLNVMADWTDEALSRAH